MPVTIEYAPLSQFLLDPKNPRLGRTVQDMDLSQDDIYEHMRNWSLEELATSFLESGFWAHEAVLCVREEVDAEECFVVVEGNRRIAALKRLQKTYSGEERSRNWLTLIQDTDEPDGLFDNVPHIVMNDRRDIEEFLGFRHVTGIKEWRPPEKAQFIAMLIDERGLSYRDVMRKIGSKTPVVERNYIAYCIFRQMEEVEEVEVEEVKDRFSVLFLSLRSRYIQTFLGVDTKFGINPRDVKPAVDDEHLACLREYSRWLFGDKETPPVVTDSRDVDKFATVLSSDDGLSYLRAVPRPSLEKAYIIAGGNQEEVYQLISNSAYNLQEALSTLHLYKTDENLLAITKRLIENTEQVRKTLEIQ